MSTSKRLYWIDNASCASKTLVANLHNGTNLDSANVALANEALANVVLAKLALAQVASTHLAFAN